MSVERDPDVDDRLLGQTLAERYQIEARLGEGAMGAVYRAKHVKVGRAFAVKLLHPRLLQDSKLLQRFEREAELAGRLRHPNVIGVVDVGETPDGMRYMVMDFAEGPDLASLLVEAPMPAQRVIHLARQMLEGLYHAHEQGLIHRDLKPENVIIEKDTHGAEVPRIVDFGIAILREGGDSSEGSGRLTTNGLVLGTPHYMAPEQAVADPLDHRIDLFALGIMIYEMLCGKLPFDGSGVEVARANLMLEPPPIAERVPYLEVDPLLEAFARRLMAKKRDMRPATAKAARDLLDLIEKDRDAAAAALGVPPDRARTAKQTQPSAPARHASGQDATFPPPLTSNLVATPSPARVRADSHHAKAISTEPTDPFGERRRGRLIGGIVLGVAVLGGGIAVMMAAGSSGKASAAKDRMALTQGPNAATDTAALDTPTPVAPEPVDTTPSDLEPVDPAPVEPLPVDRQPVGSPPTVKPGKGKPRTQDKVAQTTTATTTTATTATATATTEPPVAAPAEPSKAIDGSALAQQYQSVGAQLKALEQAKGRDVTSDLWTRYRLIRLSEAMSTQERRDTAAAILTKLTREIAARTK
jgi:serine/threonine protein kinase